LENKMASFEVKIQKIFIKDHPNADALEIGNIGDPKGTQVICRKGLYKTGDLVAYIPENTVVPEWVLKDYGFWNEEQDKGLLAGSKGDRVKMITLWGETSLGICIPIYKGEDGLYEIVLEQARGHYVREGQDVSELLGVTKYEPPIPTQLAGEVFNASTLIGVNYDIEDISKFPNVLEEGEEVQITTKLHGTNCQIVWLSPLIHDDIKAQVNINEWLQISSLVPGEPDELGYIAIASKGLGAQGLFFKWNEQNINNVYLRAVRPHLKGIAKHCLTTGQEVVVTVGEVFGSNIQTGYDYGLKEISLRAFDVYIGFRGRGRYIWDERLDSYCEDTGVPRVPVVYRGPYSFEILHHLANAPETEFNCKHVREGVIVKPIEERYVPELGRVALKHRSIAYMTKVTGEEFN
jgi:RNA ligase (TIGR02306 family)